MEDIVDFAEVPPEDQAELRQGLLDQLEYLIEEIEALRTVVGTVPEEVQSGRPTPEDLTMKEIYGLIATLDATVRRPAVDAVATGETPTVPADPPRDEVRDAGWNERDIGAILDEVQGARRRFVDALGALDLDAWTHPVDVGDETETLFAWAHRVAEADFERLRALTHRLHDANLS
jgi:hypothetical protein